VHEWNARRVQIRSTLYSLLRNLPPIFTPKPTITASEQRDGYRLEKFTFANGLGDTVYGYTLVPDKPNDAAVIYCHYHGGKYDLGKDELFFEPLFGEWQDKTPRGPALAQAGYLVLAIDAYSFGERQHQGPAGQRESGRDTESALFKRFLWEGRSLWSMMVYDDLLALNYLLTRPDIDPTRIAITGASMGGSRATWLAAIDERIKVIAPVVQYTRYQNFLASGEVNHHSFYYYVPGVLEAGLDMEAIVALSAPRPQIVLVGDSDVLSPADGIQMISDFTREVYRLYNADSHFEPHVYEGLAHVYTVEMFETMLAFFERYL
jgi:dienelactone hydrolase